MTIGHLVRTAALLILAAAPAYAGTKTIATAPANRGYPSFPARDMRCNILNLNKTAKPVTIDVIDYTGTVVSTSGPLVLAPSTAASHLSSDPSGQAAYCRFTVEGSTKKWRAVATYNNTTRYTTVQVAQ